MVKRSYGEWAAAGSAPEAILSLSLRVSGAGCEPSIRARDFSR